MMAVAEKSWSGAPFGSQAIRFDGGGIHPKNRLAGTITCIAKSEMTTSARLGPGCYDVKDGDFSAQTLAKRASGPGWTRQLEVQRAAAMPCLLNKEAWEQKKLVKTKLGPGSYDVKDFDSYGRCFKTGILDFKEKRFKQHFVNNAPPPGTYGIGGVPDAFYQEMKHRGFCTTGMLDRGGTGSRSLPTVGGRLGPGTYNVASSVDEVLAHQSGTKGPYEIFSLDRGKPIMTGHLSRWKNDLSPGQYDLKGGVDELLTSQCKNFVGQFGEAAQYPKRPIDRLAIFSLALAPRNPKEPGPGHYDHTKDHTARPLMQARKAGPFMTTSTRNDRASVKAFTGNSNPIGPGRYDIQKLQELQDTNGCESVFKSRTDRPSGRRLQFLNERLTGSAPFAGHETTKPACREDNTAASIQMSCNRDLDIQRAITCG